MIVLPLLPSAICPSASVSDPVFNLGVVPSMGQDHLHLIVSLYFRGYHFLLPVLMEWQRMIWISLHFRDSVVVSCCQYL
jgi:hypothetical protein